MSDFFKFEDPERDFPFYNGIPKISVLDWLLLLIGALVVAAIIFLPIPMTDEMASIGFCLGPLIPILIVSRGKLSLFFRIPEKKDIKPIILCVIAYFAYTMIANSLLDVLGITTNANAIVGTEMDLAFWIMIFIQLMGEELYKIIVLIIVMFLTYKISNNRKLSMIIGVIVTLLTFGFLHYPAYAGNIPQIILIIGIGSIFYLFAYLKTKNVIVSYICHLIIDSSVFLIVMAITAMGIEPTTVTSLLLAFI